MRKKLGDSKPESFSTMFADHLIFLNDIKDSDEKRTVRNTVETIKI